MEAVTEPVMDMQAILKGLCVVQSHLFSFLSFFVVVVVAVTLISHDPSSAPEKLRLHMWLWTRVCVCVTVMLRALSLWWGCE